MNQYADSEYYFNTFKGSKLTPDNVDKYLQEASEKIDSITFNRIVGIGFDNLTKFQKDKIQMAVCYQAEYIFENGFNNENKPDVASYSVLDISVSVDSNKTKTMADKECMSEQAYDLIKKTGLASRGFRY